MATSRVAEYRPLLPALIAVGLLHAVGWGLLIAAAVIGVGGLGEGPTSSAAVLAVGFTAYALGMRHAFDADHIAAIDNTTRSLQERGRPAHTVGFWFSAGHSTVVFVLCALLAAGLGAIGAALEDDDSLLHLVTGVWGPSVSSVFLLVIAGFGVVALLSRRHGQGGPVWRALGATQQIIDRPSRMYAVGLLFGLGFDTATEIGLLALAGGAALTAAPWWAVMGLPLVFAAGMSALDTTQGALARRAYAHSARSNGYSTWVTTLSVGAAVMVAAVQLAGVAQTSLGMNGLAWLADLPIDDAGIWLTALLLASWLGGIVVLAVRSGTARPATDRLKENR